MSQREGNHFNLTLMDINVELNVMKVIATDMLIEQPVTGKSSTIDYL